MNQQTRIKTYALLTVTALIWGAQPACIKWLDEVWSPVTIPTARFAIMGVIFLFLHYRRMPERFWPRGKEWHCLVLMGFTGMFLNNVLQFTGISATSVTNATLISATTPSITAFLSAVFLREYLRQSAWCGIALSFVGVLFVVSGGQWEILSRLAFNHGDMLCFLSQIAWAVYSLISLKVMDRLSVIGVTGWSSFFGCLCNFFYGAASGSLTLAPLTGLALFSFLYVTFLGGILAMFFWNMGVQNVGPSFSSIFLNFMPVAGMIAGYIWFDETAGAAQLLGAVAIGCGIRLTVKEK